METRELVWHLMQCNLAEYAQALQVLTAEETKPKYYLGLLAVVADTEDSRLAFWCLDLLWKHFEPQLQQNASEVIPQLLTVLTDDKLQVLDRAVLVLAATGPASVEALVQAAYTSGNASHVATYLAAIRGGRQNLYPQAKAVLALLTAKLSDPVQEIRWTALCVLMDISPLRPWFDERMDKNDFELLYGQLLTVAQELATYKQYAFAAYYAELLTA